MQQPQTLLEGKYEILAKIREGGMGTIYRVRHRLLDEVRVVKVMQPHVVADADLKRRFLDEAKTATRLKHPNVCTIHDFALDEDGTAYLVMEFIDGINLSELLKSRGSPGLPLSLEIAHQALLALGYLHRKSVIHRDVAPDNLMLTRDDEGRPLIKLIDLGIAKTADQGSDKTATGVFLGKLKYASPEQYGKLPPGERLDGRSDLYGLGVVLYELLTGVRPFRGDSPAELLHAHLFDPPLPFGESDPAGSIPEEVRAAVLKALEKRRESRYSGAEEFDREILALRHRFGRAEDLESTMAVLTGIEPAGASSNVTPSAQNRLDRHFGAHTTPRPSSELLTVAPTVASDARALPASRLAAPKPSGPKDVVPGPPEPHDTRPLRAPGGGRRRLAWTIATAALVAAAVVVWRASERPRPAGEIGQPRTAVARSSAPATAPAALAEPTSSPVPSSQATELPPAAVAAETPAPETTSPPSSRPSPSEDPRLRAETDAARRDADRARARAERAGADTRARDSWDRARRADSDAENLARRGRLSSAATSFERAAGLYAAAEAAVAAAVAPTNAPPTREPAVARLEPTRAAAPPSTEVPPAAPSPATKAVASDADRIREVLHEYERAHNTLDLDRFAKVFPSFVAAQRSSLERAWSGLRSQRLELEVRQVDVKGTQATVHAYQRLYAVPQAGVEQRDSRDVVLRLEKRGDSWVIVSRT